MNIPAHVGFIMDGNSSWAQKHNKSTIVGYQAGFDAFLNAIENANSLGIKYVTCYTFSSENWQRPKQWLTSFFALAQELMESTKFMDKIKELDGKIRFIGNLGKFDQKFQDIMQNIEQQTKDNKGIVVCCAVSYGGRDEIIRAAKKIAKLGLAFTEETMTANLDTAGIPDPDLIIRTSNKKRLSNFLLWQVSYSEFYCSKLFWPEFDKAELKAAIEDFAQRQRTYGA